MSDETWELIYSFCVGSDVTGQDVASVCVEVRSLPGVVDVELGKVIHIPGAVGMEYDYQMVVILQGKEAVSVVQQYLDQYRQDVSHLKINLYIGTHQILQ